MADFTPNIVPVSTLLRAQATNPPAPHSVQKVRAIIGVKPTTIQPGAKSSGTSKGNLPRGSLVDILA